jgi:hypothetical protein
MLLTLYNCNALRRLAPGLHGPTARRHESNDNACSSFHEHFCYKNLGFSVRPGGLRRWEFRAPPETLKSVRLGGSPPSMARGGRIVLKNKSPRTL